MNKNNNLLNEIEDEIRKYFPIRWDKKDVDYLIGEHKFVLDMKALNLSLNIPLRDFILRGGKRLRPILFLTCLKLFGYDYKQYLDLAILIELIHNATLILDDIEDNGELRRGKLTCHKKFGIDIAINAGMGLHFIPIRVLISNQKNLSVDKRLRLWKIYSEEMINVAFGQALDIYWHNNPFLKISQSKYLEMVRLKTGSLMRMSTRMACAIAGINDKSERVFSNFAETIGMAFQIIDDSLDLLSSKKLGKSYGNDIKEGKISLPFIFALKRAKTAQKKRLIEILKQHTTRISLIDEAISIVMETRGIDEAISYANELTDKAWQELESYWGNKGELTELKDLTYFFIKRKY